MMTLEDRARSLAATIDRRRFIRRAAGAITAGVAGATIARPRAALAAHSSWCCGPSSECSHIGRSSCCSGWSCKTSNCPKCYTCGGGTNSWCCTSSSPCRTTCCADCRHGANCNFGNYCICAKTVGIC